MPIDDRKLVSVLKAELAFLKQGGYQNSPSAPWRWPLFFQDSRICLNVHRARNPRPCHECVMTSLVPADCLGERFPCRHFALNSAGFTIDTYCRLGTFAEAESALETWLRKKIRELETADPFK